VFPSCFRHMVQVFQLFRTCDANVSFRCCKSRSAVVHIAMDPPSAAAAPAVAGSPACAWVWKDHERQARKTMRAQIETEASVGHRAARGTKRAQDTERRGRLDASLRPDLRALAFPVSNLIYVAGALRAGPMEVNSLW
jgi:hypothetical protein